MRRMIWIAVGVGIGVVVVIKGRDLLRQLTPQGVSEKVGRAAADTRHRLGTRLATFVDDARAAMAEREAELRDTLGLSEAPDPN